MDEWKLKSGKMVASIEKPIHKSSKNNKAMKCTNNTCLLYTSDAADE